MITARQAKDLAEIIATSGIIREVKEMARSELWTYFRELLYRDHRKSILTVRRMW